MKGAHINIEWLAAGLDGEMDQTHLHMQTSKGNTLQYEQIIFF